MTVRDITAASRSAPFSGFMEIKRFDKNARTWRAPKDGVPIAD
jgi:hypothetical protein